MPNWTSTTLEVTGNAQDILRFKSIAAQPTKEGSVALSFNGFIPMPDSLHVTEGGHSELAEQVFFGSGFEQNRRPWMDKEDIFCAEALSLYLDVVDPDAHKEGRIRHENRKNHGHPSWYGWSCANWGTKWDACHASLDDEDETRLLYSFDTAWSPAEPVLFAMSEQFPELAFTATFKEESGEFYYQAEWKDGEKLGETQLEDDACEDEDEDIWGDDE